VRTLDAALGWAQLGVWVVLAAAALNVSHVRRDVASRWLAVTFASLAIVVTAGRFFPQDEADPPEWVFKALILVIALFPYLMFRFVVALSGTRRWERIVAHGLTLAVGAETLFLPNLSEMQDRRTPRGLAFIVVFLAQWAFLLGTSGIRLWALGRRQKGVARRRMLTMASGLFLLVFVLVISAVPTPSEEPTVLSLVTGVLSLIAGPLLLLGFAPPRVVRQLWRSGPDQALREAEVGIVKAITKEDVAASLLPPSVDLFGGEGAALLDAERAIVGSHHMPADALGRLIERLPADTAQRYEPVAVGDAYIVGMENGWLVVATGPMTPFFSTDELQTLSALAVFADLALGRASMYEREFRAREAMRDFVAIASHDLRTPVTVIQGFTEMLTPGFAEVTEEQKANFIAAINRQVVHLDRLVGDMLTVSKLDVEEIEVFAAPVELVASTKETVDVLVEGCAVDVREDGPVTVFADPEHVARIVQNYIKNAIVYGAPPISVSVSTDDGFGVIRVIDEGPGVPSEFVDHLFEKFARADKKKSKAVQGTGLGLSIVKGLARANGGDAWYEPNVPDGACFAVKLPLIDRVNGEGAR
jgi:signal transduction histidine kinase